MTDNGFFAFEQEFVESLHCIPMRVRLKLDSCGVKLKLVHWNKLSAAERQSLIAMPCDTPEATQAYKEYLQRLVVHYAGSPASELPVETNPPWLTIDQIPAQVQDKAQDCSLSINVEQWANLSPDRRFALFKLSRPSHENANFIPAMKEFGLA